MVAQIGINTDDSPSDASAILDVKSDDKGMLIPRMDSESRMAISSPATGLVVYDNNTHSFWYYDNAQWNEIRTSSNLIPASDLLGVELKLPCLDIVSQLPVNGFPTAMAHSNNHAFIVDEFNGELKIIDISQPTAPILKSSLNIGSRPRAIAILGDYVYVIDSDDDALKVIDVSLPTAPNLVSSLPIGEHPRGIAISGNYAFVVDGFSDDLKVIDISNPNAPNTITSFPISRFPLAITILGNYAYILEAVDDELKIVDISIPSTPILQGSLPVGTDPKALAVSGDYAYVVDAISEDLKIINISIPSAPALVGSLPIGDFPRSVVAKDNYVYVAESVSDKLKVVDVSDPANPVLSNNFSIGPFPVFVTTLDNYIYVLDYTTQDLKIISLCDWLPNIDCGSDNLTQILKDDIADNQTIDLLQLNGTTLEVSLENTGEIAKTLDLANANILSLIQDADTDTQIQVEESANEDVIRFDLGGFEHFWMDNNQFSVFGNNISNHPTLLFNSNNNAGTFNKIANVFNGVSIPPVAPSEYKMNFFINNNQTLSLQGDGGVLINENYSLPLTDGFENQALATDGNGIVNWTTVNTINSIEDADNNTKIQVEANPNENLIRMDVENSQLMVLSPDNTATITGGTRHLLTLRSSNNTNETGIAFKNTDDNFVWNIHRTPAISNSNLADFVISGGNAAIEPTSLTEQLRIDINGNLGIGTDAPNFKLQIGNNGDGTEARANAWNTFSDQRWKRDLVTIQNAIEKIEQVNGYYYKWKDRPDTSTQVGLIAQEIEMVLPEVIATDIEGYKSIDYSKLNALLLQGIKEQKRVIQNHTFQLNSLEKEMENIRVLLLDE